MPSQRTDGQPWLPVRALSPIPNHLNLVDPVVDPAAVPVAAGVHVSPSPLPYSLQFCGDKR